jgi:hypothetical protein
VDRTSPPRRKLSISEITNADNASAQLHLPDVAPHIGHRGLSGQTDRQRCSGATALGDVTIVAVEEPFVVVVVVVVGAAALR